MSMLCRCRSAEGADASCLACADITKRFEQDVARELWGDARISYDAPSRRKKERKTHIILTDPENPPRTVKVPPMLFYRMGRAGLLEGMSDTVDVSGAWKLQMISDHEKNKEFERKYGLKLTARFRHVPESFARLLAKIGYGQILTSLDPSDLHLICVPYILGQRKNPSYIVGGKLIPDLPDPGLGPGADMLCEVRGPRRAMGGVRSPDYERLVWDSADRAG
jgi:hypothetical protein